MCCPKYLYHTIVPDMVTLCLIQELFTNNVLSPNEDAIQTPDVQIQVKSLIISRLALSIESIVLLINALIL